MADKQHSPPSGSYFTNPDVIKGLTQLLESQRRSLDIKDDPRSACQDCLTSVFAYLVFKGVPPDLLKPLDHLNSALMDLDHGLKRLDLFEPDSSKDHGNPLLEDLFKGLGAAAITLSPDLTQRVARKLGVEEKRIQNFRKELTSSRSKSVMARLMYDATTKEAATQTSEDKRKRAELILQMLEPVTTKSDIR